MTDPRDPTAGWGFQIGRSPEPAAPMPADKGLIDGLGIGYRLAQVGPDTGVNGKRYRQQIYRDLADQLRRNGFGDFWMAGVRGDESYRPGWDKERDRFWQAIADGRKRGLVKGYDDVHDAASLDAHANGQRQDDFAKVSGEAQRLTGAGSIGSFIGGMGASWDDPETWLTAGIPVGSAGGGVARQVIMTGLREGAVNAGAALAVEPLVRADAQQLGVKRTWRDTAFDAALQAGFGFVGGALGKGADLYLTDRAAVKAFRDVVPEENWTPDERAAVNVIERTEDIADASPYVRSPAGDDAHFRRMDAGMRSVAQGLNGSPDDLPVPRPVPHVPMATMWRAIIGIEGGTDARGRFRTSPAGAVGPAQVMPATGPEAARLAGVPWDEKRFASDHVYNEALGQAYFKKQLDTFGDPAKAAAAYNAGPGSARSGKGLRGAMARAARAGEPDNWEKYLPAETRAYVENFRRRTGLPDAPEGMPRMADDVAPPEWSPLPDEPVLPDLRRELFPSDDAWRVAQVLDEAEQLNLPSLVDDVLPQTEGYRTAKGSSYRVEYDGTTVRDKAPRPEHPGEQGVQPRSERTVYLDPADMDRLALIQARGTDPVGIVFNGDHAAIRYVEGADAGKVIKDTVTPVQREPAMGLVPLETWQDGRRAHFGNPIVEMMPRARAADRAPMVRRPEAQPAPARSSGAAPEPAIMARGAARFDDPAGPAAIEQAMGLGHDVKTAVDAGDLDGVNFAASGIVERNGTAVALPESAKAILEELDAEDAALAAIRGCL